MSREDDIQKLIDGVHDLESTLIFDYSGVDYTICPICEERGPEGSLMKDLKHELNCIWLIAKDLNTGKEK
jgi:hypothetical protein